MQKNIWHIMDKLQRLVQPCQIVKTAHLQGHFHSVKSIKRGLQVAIGLVAIFAIQKFQILDRNKPKGDNLLRLNHTEEEGLHQTHQNRRTMQIQEQ